MKTKYFIFAASALVALASCSNDEYIGDNNGLTAEQGDGSIQFTYNVPNATRADIVGNEAAKLLGNGFYVTGTKGTEAETSPSPTLVFDDYLVYFDANTAGTTKSNTANWEYVGVTPGTDPYDGWVYLTSMSPARVAAPQTIKYWDYSTAQYDFMAFSTGNKTPVTGTPANASQVGVTAMKYGTDLAGGATAYTFKLFDATGLENTYITDITKVVKANYKQEVQLQFKNLGSKVRVALYETVPGYSIQASSVRFYTEDDGTKDFTDAKGEPAALISSDTKGFASDGVITVFFPSVGTNNANKENYNKASATVSSTAGTQSKTFGNLANKATAEGKEPAGALYLGRSLPNATYAGTEAKQYYTIVFPTSSAYPLTLRVDYTLIATDGSGETINVKGARAVVPSTYTTWQPNYAYTYVFKISDNTNGWTGASTDDPGLFPITFDAVVAEVKDANGQQTTITTVATPTITTYQQLHPKEASTDEYSKSTKGKDNQYRDLYVQVMNNKVEPATPIIDLDENATGASTKKSLLYKITKGDANYVASEAQVMDALQNQSSVDGGTGAITGRNSVVLTPDATHIDATVESIVNGADDKAIDLRDKDGSGDPIEDSGKGKAAKIDIDQLATGTYAYVYDYSDAAKVNTTIYQPETYALSAVIPNGKRYTTTTILNGITYESNKTAADEAVSSSYLYFSKTTEDGENYTYSFYSVDDKTTLPAGLLKVEITAGNLPTTSSTTYAAGMFVFDTYVRNTGKYAVKVFKVVD